MSECVLWTGYIDSNGYGHTGTDWAHRVTYEEAFGPIPEGLHIDHVYERGCRSRACVNVEHLEAVTQAENNRRAMAVRLADGRKCGHPYRPEDGDCRECARDRSARYRAAVKAGTVEPAKITCAECGQVADNCAKGLCRRCYGRNYYRAKQSSAKVA